MATPWITSKSKLVVALTGFKSSISVPIKPEWDVHNLKVAILPELPNKPPGLVAAELVLYRTEVPDGQGLVDAVCVAQKELLTKASQELSEIFTNEPAKETVSVIVEIPSEALASSSLQDVTSELLERWKAPITLPPPEQLAEFFRRPLADREKVPLLPDAYQSLVLIGETPGRSCPPAVLDRLFRQSTTERCHDGLMVRFQSALRENPPESKDSEATYHAFWDDNIGRIIHLIDNSVICTRDTSKRASTKRLRPDALCIKHGICLERGEEKTPDSPEDPRAELADKLVWTYDPAPYILGHYAFGATITHVALLPPLPGTRKPRILDIAKFTLETRADRLQHLIHVIHVSSLLGPLATVIGHRMIDEYTLWKRGDKSVEVTGVSICKTYTGTLQALQERKQRLSSVYGLLDRKKVVNVDKLFFIQLLASPVPTLDCFLEPRCTARHPRTPKEVFDAIKCVLKALISMHSDPVLLHRDIRWPNIVLFSGSDWILIDFEDFSVLPTVAAPDLESNDHCPSVFSDNHGTEVDIWAVGRLLAASHHRSIPGYPRGMEDLGHRLMEEALLPAGLTADDALTHVAVLEASLLP